MVNIYRLAKEIAAWGEKHGKVDYPTQSTLHRLYSGISKSFDDVTAVTLGEFFLVPPSLVKGLEMAADDYGFDITIKDIRLIHLLRQLTDAQREHIYEEIRLFLPDAPSLSNPGHGLTLAFPKSTKQ